jgi:Cof subfamily protein (haloacid dehalogenase superfamily)
MNEIRFIVTDYDGTLRHSGGTISEANISAVSEFVKRGGHFVIATARPLFGLLPGIGKLKKYIDYLILCNGGSVWARKGNRFIHEQPVPITVVREIIRKHWDDRDYFFMLISRDRTYINGPAPKGPLGGYLKTLKYETVSSENFLEANPVILNIEISASPGKLQALVRSLNKKNRGRFTAMLSWTNFMEIYSSRASKGRALDLIRRKLGIPKKSTAAFGDGNNDIELFLHAGTAVAMENATRRLKRSAHHVTRHYNEDGVAHFIREHILANKAF